MEPLLERRLQEQHEKAAIGECAVKNIGSAADLSLKLDPKLAKRFSEQNEKLATGRSAVENVGSRADRSVSLDPVLARRWSQLENGQEENLDPRAWHGTLSPGRRPELEPIQPEPSELDLKLAKRRTSLESSRELDISSAADCFSPLDSELAKRLARQRRRLRVASEEMPFDLPASVPAVPVAAAPRCTEGVADPQVARVLERRRAVLDVSLGESSELSLGLESFCSMGLGISETWPTVRVDGRSSEDHGHWALPSEDMQDMQQSFVQQSFVQASAVSRPELAAEVELAMEAGSFSVLDASRNSSREERLSEAVTERVFFPEVESARRHSDRHEVELLPTAPAATVPPSPAPGYRAMIAGELNLEVENARRRRDSHEVELLPTAPAATVPPSPAPGYRAMTAGELNLEVESARWHRDSNEATVPPRSPTPSYRSVAAPAEVPAPPAARPSEAPRRSDGQVTPSFPKTVAVAVLSPRTRPKASSESANGIVAVVARPAPTCPTPREQRAETRSGTQRKLPEAPRRVEAREDPARRARTGPVAATPKSAVRGREEVVRARPLGATRGPGARGQEAATRSHKQLPTAQPHGQSPYQRQAASPRSPSPSVSPSRNEAPVHRRVTARAQSASLSPARGEASSPSTRPGQGGLSPRGPRGLPGRPAPRTQATRVSRPVEAAPTPRPAPPTPRLAPRTVHRSEVDGGPRSPRIQKVTPLAGAGEARCLCRGRTPAQIMQEVGQLLDAHRVSHRRESETRMRCEGQGLRFEVELLEEGPGWYAVFHRCSGALLQYRQLCSHVLTGLRP
eukprot:CAMPEP_0170592164 /NCGR_PEP_ID=MMETSP0224-20130122/12784_1 /TAXON_ID=285029 /ORGANISM="Togula jolla, Strain CCCM 725" /LENGTH=799 /DNA_ID=CAMNT_0010916063 /DNA_START=138 /DNA_END=2537 /DNA_ORIENTATION=+